MAKAPTIAQRIALEGGTEIIAELKALGVTGEKAFKQIEDAANRAGSIDAKVGAAVARIGKYFGGIGEAAGIVGRAFNGMSEAFALTGKRIGLIAAAVSGAAVAFYALASSAANEVDQLGDAADAAGFAADAYSRLQYAATQVGLSNEQFGAAMQRLAVLMEEFNNATNGQAKSQTTLGKALGLSTGQFSNASQVWSLLVNTMGDMQSSTAKTALAVKLFGRVAGSDMAELMGKGAAGVAQLATEAENLGVAVTDADRALADRFLSSMRGLGEVAKSVKRDLGLVFAEPFARLADKGSNALATYRQDLIKAAESIRDLVFPIIQDIVYALEFRDDHVQNKAIIQMRDEIISFGKEAIRVIKGLIIPAFLALHATMGVVAELINGLFGTDFSANTLLATIAILKLIAGFNLLWRTFQFGFSIFNLLMATFGAFPAIVILLGIAIGVLVGYFLAAHWDEIAAAFSNAWTAASETVIAVWEALKAGWDNLVASITQAGEDIATPFVAVWEALKAGWANVVESVTQAIADMQAAWDAFAGYLEELWNNLVASISAAIDDISGFVSTMIDGIKDAIEWLKSLISKKQEAANTPDGNATGGFARPAFSTGGAVWGKGTSTSDSIDAKLSRGEYVIQQQAVQFYGPKLLEAINKMRLPKDFFKRMGKFSTGGLVTGMTSFEPAYAFASARAPNTAQSSSRGSTINLHLDGELPFKLEADEQTAERLSRFALQKQIKSAGRRPNWYGGGR